jgi:hypothetical protein
MRLASVFVNTKERKKDKATESVAYLLRAYQQRVEELEAENESLKEVLRAFNYESR